MQVYQLQESFRDLANDTLINMQINESVNIIVGLPVQRAFHRVGHQMPTSRQNVRMDDKEQSMDKNTTHSALLN